MSFQGKTALITGGTAGMGSATAVAMAEMGVSVIITGRDETRGASTVEEVAKQIPLRRVAEVHGLSDVITFLATPAAGYINGAAIPVDGGRLAI